jgi:hypothetical protein
MDDRIPKVLIPMLRKEFPEIVQSEITPYVPMLSGERINKLIEKWKPILDYKASDESEEEQKKRLKNTVIIESGEVYPIDTSS